MQVLSLLGLCSIIHMLSLMSLHLATIMISVFCLIAKNLLESIPTSIGNLSKLIRLDLHQNREWNLSFPPSYMNYYSSFFMLLKLKWVISLICAIVCLLFQEYQLFLRP